MKLFPCVSYSLADRAWHQLRARGEDQAIVLTGESGAGKTEAGKLVMQYIAAVTGHTRECQDIKYQLLQSNPVLEGDVAINVLITMIVQHLMLTFCALLKIHFENLAFVLQAIP